MKKTIILYFILIISAVVNGQKSTGYISFSDSGSDKLQYLINNFESQKEKYLGQPLAVFFNDLEIDIQTLLVLYQPNSYDYLDGFLFLFYDMDTYEDLEGNERKAFFESNKNYRLELQTTEPLIEEQFISLLEEDSYGWNAQMEAYYSSYIIKSIDVGWD